MATKNITDHTPVIVVTVAHRPGAKSPRRSPRKDRVTVMIADDDHLVVN